MAATVNTQVLFVSRPVGMVDPAAVFKIQKVPVPAVADGQVLVKALYLSLDPAMRGWMNDRRSYIAPIKLGDVMRGGIVGEVLESKSPRFQKGDLVQGMLGWQEYAVVDDKNLTKSPAVSDPRVLLGAAGMTGLTAYFGLLDIGKAVAGETVLISGAAGATGSVAGQIAKLKGCRVIGLAGSDDKCAWLEQIGFDKAINYKNKTTAELGKAISEAAPTGIDVYFDNVGGEILDLALARINLKGRVVLCGGISQYNSTTPSGPVNYLALLTQRARMEGFIVFDYADRFPAAVGELLTWIKDGKIEHRDTVVEGLENAPNALLMLFEGQNTGKLLVKIGERSAKL